MHVYKFYGTIIIMGNKNIKSKVIALRQVGKTYTEIQQVLDEKISKSTLSYWCNGVVLSLSSKKRINKIILDNTVKSRVKALESNRIKRKDYLSNLRKSNIHLKEMIKNKDVAKVALAMLYLGEGSKCQKGSLMFGNSDPQIISLFLHLLRNCYNIDEDKFRCTLQCRADQDIKTLEEYWSKVTKIPLNQFYKARIDPRTIGKPSKKKDYKGVCRIDYFSAQIYIELKQMIEIIYMGR